MSDTYKIYIYRASAIIVLLAAASYTHLGPVACYPLAIGGVGITLCSFFHSYQGKSIRIRRLMNMQAIGGISMVASATLMFFHLRHWLPALLIGAILTLYSAFMTSHALKQEEEK